MILKNRPYTLIPGKKEGVVLYDEFDFAYYKDNKSYGRDGCSTWFCKHRRKFKCPASVRAREDLIIWQRREHNHGY